MRLNLLSLKKKGIWYYMSYDLETILGFQRSLDHSGIEDPCPQYLLALEKNLVPYRPWPSKLSFKQKKIIKNSKPF